MTKKKKIIIIMAVILIIAIAFVGGQAYAKYMSKVTGQGVADIAAWNFKVNEKEDAIQKIDLKSTINNEKISQNKVAPGTEGSFQIKIDTTGSEVGINYNIKFENETAKPKNLKFIYNNQEYDSLKKLESVLNGTINANESNKERIMTVKWVWKYQTGTTEEEIRLNDLEDTKNAKSISDYTFDIIVSGVQVNPNN